MTRVIKDNRELRVDDHEVAEYLKNGYSVIDDHGNIVERGNAINYESAMLRINELENYISTLRLNLQDAYSRIDELEGKNKKLTAELKKAQKETKSAK